MYLKELSLINFKNLNQLDINCSKVLNCFVGDNGAGKTNILDSIYYLSMCKSRFQSNDQANIKEGEQYFMIKGKYGGGKEYTVSCGFVADGKKTFKIDDNPYKRLSDHIGLIPIVIITPSDTTVIDSGGEERRKFLNTVISQIDKEYLDSLLRYNNSLNQRNSLLKSNKIDRDFLDVIDDRISNYATIIYEKRKELVKSFIPIFQEVYKVVSDNKEIPELIYKSDLDSEDLKSLLNKNLDRDIILKHTSKGIHRDDLIMTLDGRSLRYAGSQGQQKTYLTALKMSEYRIIKQYSGFKPILLLDDIFDKLDADRVEKLISLVAGKDFGQIFITDSNKNRVDRLLEKLETDFKLFQVADNTAKLLISS